MAKLAMAWTVAMVALILTVATTTVAGRKRFARDPELDADWTAWKTKFGKLYEGQEEFNRRFIFEQNLKKIQHHNLAHSAGEISFTLGANQFADLTAEEYAANIAKHRHHHGHHHHHHHHHHHNKTSGEACSPPRPAMDNVHLPASIDWRTQGYVTPVRQGNQCLNPQFFAINGALEGQWYRKTGQLIAMSEQNLNDCCGSSAGGCTTSCTFDQTYEYIKDTGIESLADYPDTGASQKCMYDPAKRAARVSGYDYITPANDEMVLQTYVATTGPISIYLDASQQSFQLYTSGVYDEPKCSSTQLDYAAVIVGYGADAATGAEYWIVKNSWGTSWGMAGYILMSRNKDNQCGIATQASYPFFSC